MDSLVSRRNFARGMAAACLAANCPGQQGTEAFERNAAGARKGEAASAWFTKAGFGVFFHWGPSSISQGEISWSMFRDVGGYWPVEKYNSQADMFDPKNYDPDKWMAAAARAGFRYSVLTTCHSDGYALWPSDFGDFSTKEHMHGRDLVKPFVEACRKHGIKVGFYYSPTNWNFNPKGWPYRGFPLRDPKFLYRRPERTIGTPRFVDLTPAQAQPYFDQLYARVKGQVGELLTRYGKIDLLWWDGYDWPDVLDHHGKETEAWVRKIQPGIVLNDRYRLWSEHPKLGDFSTEFENRNPEGRPQGAWEQCEAICGGWSYRGPRAQCKPTSYIVERLVRNRAWGGNYLPDWGPREDGTLPDAYYTACDQLAAWMAHSGESVHDVEAGPYPKLSDVPVTLKGSTWYVHFLSPAQQTATLQNPRDPKSARHLRTGQKVAWKRTGERILVELAAAARSDYPEVVALDFA
jgi:alpha-L-fucosidase